MSGPLIYLIDIESSPIRGYTWGKWEQDVIWIEEDWKLLCFAYKELGAEETHSVSRLDFKDKTDKALTKAIWKVLDRADVVIGHNGDGFDVPKLRAKFIEHGLPPTRPFKSIDTLKIARSQFLFTSNKLDDLSKTLKLGEKVDTGGHKLWKLCMEGDAEAWDKMITYNKHDVVLLEKIYNRLAPFYPSHPNLKLYQDDELGCPVCKSERVQRRGFTINRVTRARRFQCQNCHHWFSRRLKKGEE